MANDLIKNYGVDEDTVTVINNPVSESILERQSEVKKTKRKHQILYVGELSHQKGVERLIYAFELCSEKDTELQLKIVGDGPKREKLTNLCCDLGIENHVEFCGEVDNVADYYLRSRATVLSSRYEGFPNVLIESITLGTPIVAFDCPSGPAEIVQEKKNGYLVKQNNVDLFAERILDIIDGSFNISKIIDTGKKYQSTNILPKYESILIKNERSN